jgi:uridylate kinase
MRSTLHLLLIFGKGSIAIRSKRRSTSSKSLVAVSLRSQMLSSIEGRHKIIGTGQGDSGHQTDQTTVLFATDFESVAVVLD